MAEVEAKKVILKNLAGEYLLPITEPYVAGNGIKIEDNIISADINKLTVDGVSLSNKVDYSNTQWAVDACIPDYNSVIIVSSPFTAPCAGFISWNNNGTANCKINDNVVYIGGNDVYNEGPTIMLLGKGDTINYSADVGTSCFIPLKGASNNA